MSLTWQGANSSRLSCPSYKFCNIYAVNLHLSWKCFVHLELINKFPVAMELLANGVFRMLLSTLRHSMSLHFTNRHQSQLGSSKHLSIIFGILFSWIPIILPEHRWSACLDIPCTFHRSSWSLSWTGRPVDCSNAFRQRACTTWRRGQRLARILGM